MTKKMEPWSAKKLILASMAVAIFSSALTGAAVVWVVSGQKPPEQNFFPPNPRADTDEGIRIEAPPELPPADPVKAGNWHYDRQHWSEAVKSYVAAIDAGLDTPDLRTDLGNCYRFSKQPETALMQYEIAQQQDPHHEFSLLNQIGLYAEDLKNPTRASEIARRFITIFPDSPNIAQAQKYLAAE